MALRMWNELNDWRHDCNFYPKFDFWQAYDVLQTNDDEFNDDLYKKIETTLLDWLVANTKQKVYYAGDLRFEFKDLNEVNAFDKKFGSDDLFIENIGFIEFKLGY